MDSINRNQPEKNHEDISGQAVVDRIKETIKLSPNCFFCTSVSKSGPPNTRPMNVRQVDDTGALWFLSANDSKKNAELAIDSAVTLYFQGTQHSDFLELRGKAEISVDKSKIKELWEPILKVWFTDGIDDPRITVIKVTIASGYYWDNKHGNTIAGVKMMIGAVMGVTLDDSIEGQMRP